MKIQNRECLDPECDFRFPQSVTGKLIEYCPLCNGPTRVVAEYQTAVEPWVERRADPLPSSCIQPVADLFKDASVSEPHEQESSAPQFDCHVLLDNLRSILNVGSIFRTVDGIGGSHVHLCGMTPTPEHPRLAKTALGTERTIPWQYHTNGLAAVRQLKASGRYIIGLESGGNSRSLFEPDTLLEVDSSTPLLIIVGNEVAGIDPGILEHCNIVTHLPMVGIKASLNVAVAFGIGIYQLRFCTQPRLSTERRMNAD